MRRKSQLGLGHGILTENVQMSKVAAKLVKLKRMRQSLDFGTVPKDFRQPARSPGPLHSRPDESISNGDIFE